MMADKLSRRAFLQGIGLAGAGLALAACAVPAASSGADDMADAASVHLVLWGWWQPRMDVYDQVAQEWASQRDGYTIEVLAISSRMEKIAAALEAGTHPNLFKMGEEFFPMRREGLLLEFPEEYFPTAWYEETYPSVDWDAYGRYVIPTGVSSTMLVYNRRMFEEAGLDPDQPPATWADFLIAAEATTQRDAGGITRCGVVPTEEWLGYNQVLQLGGNVVDASGDVVRATFDSEEAIAGFRHIADLVLKHEVWDNEFPWNGEAVGTGLACMTEEQSWIVGEFRSTYPDIFADLGFAPPPTPTGQPDPVYGYKSTVLSVSAFKGDESAYDAVYDFLKYLYVDAGTEAYWALAQMISLAPVRSELLSDPRLQEDAGLAMAAQMQALEHDPVEPPPALGAIYSDAYFRMLEEGVPVEEAMAIMNQEAQALFDQGIGQEMR